METIKLELQNVICWYEVLKRNFYSSIYDPFLEDFFLI